MKKSIVGLSSLFLCSMAFGSFGIWIRLLSREIGSYQQIVFRNIFAFVFVILVLLIRKIGLNVSREVNKSKLFAFATIVPISVILYVFAILNGKISVVTFAFYAGTIAVSWLTGVILFKEKTNIWGFVSLFLVFIGLFVISYPLSISNINLGFLLALASGSIDGLANVFRKELGPKVDKFILVFFTALGGVVVSGIMILVSGNELYFFPQLTTTAWIVGAIFGFLLVCVNFLLLLGFQNFDLSLGSIVLATELFFATLFGFLVLKETPTILELSGGLLILIASILPNFIPLYSLKSRNKK